MSSRKRKVLFVIDNIGGSGAERSLIEIAKNLHRYEPVFVHIYGIDILKQSLLDAGINVHSLNIPLPRNFGQAEKALARVYEEEQPDIVHSTLYKSDIVARRLRDKYDIPLVSSFVNNSYSKLRFEGLNLSMKIKMRLVQLYDAYTSRKVDFFFSNSKTIKYAKGRSTLVNLDKVKVIPRGRNIDNFTGNADKEAVAALKKSLGVENKQVLLNVGRMIERKGQMDVVNAMPEILKAEPDTVLLIAGHGSFEKNLEERIAELGLEESVQILGRRSDVPELLALADIFVFPSYFEGLPGSLIEAMLAGKIIVCSDIPENQECVTPESAIFFKRANVPEIAEKIIYTLQKKEELGHLGKEARKLAVEKFDVRKIAEEYEQTYDMIVQNRKQAVV